MKISLNWMRERWELVVLGFTVVAFGLSAVFAVVGFGGDSRNNVGGRGSGLGGGYLNPDVAFAFEHSVDGIHLTTPHPFTVGINIPNPWRRPRPRPGGDEDPPVRPTHKPKPKPKPDPDPITVWVPRPKPPPKVVLKYEYLGCIVAGSGEKRALMRELTRGEMGFVAEEGGFGKLTVKSFDEDAVLLAGPDDDEVKLARGATYELPEE